MTDLKNRVAAITGAGSGIGRALALELANEGVHLALSDIDISSAKETAQAASAMGVRATATAVDVADRQQIAKWAQQVVDEHGGVSLLFNNAGITVVESIEAIDYTDFERVMAIDFWGVVYGTKTFLPILKRQPRANIINISSVFGLIAAPSQAAYNAAKFAVRGFTECLRLELELEGARVAVSCVHPGGIATNIVKNAHFGQFTSTFGGVGAFTQAFQRAARQSPTQAAKTIIDGVKQNQPRILVGTDAHVIDACQRLLPSAYQKLFARYIRWMASRHGDLSRWW